MLSYYSNNVFALNFSAVIGFSLVGYLFCGNTRRTARIHNIREVTVPSLSIGCGKDAFLHSKSVAAGANCKHFPMGVKFIELQDAGHWGHLDEVDLMVEFVECMGTVGLRGFKHKSIHARPGFLSTTSMLRMAALPVEPTLTPVRPMLSVKRDLETGELEQAEFEVCLLLRLCVVTNLDIEYPARVCLE
jgi:hypothetical protein